MYRYIKEIMYLHHVFLNAILQQIFLGEKVSFFGNNWTTLN